MTLQILIATLGEEGLQRLSTMSLPEIPGVKYLVSCQTGRDEPMPDVPYFFIRRHDIDMIFPPGRGLSANRNILLRAATGDYLLIADDDMSYTEEQLKALLDDLEKNERKGIIAYRVDGAGDKKYPAHAMSLDRKMPRGYSPSSVELVIKLDTIKYNYLIFCQLFGIGSPILGCGEEDVFLWNARRINVHIEYVPLTIGTHTGGLSTGQRPPTRPVWRARGAVLYLTHPRTWRLRILRQAMRAKSLEAMRLMFYGAEYTRMNMDYIDLTVE